MTLELTLSLPKTSIARGSEIATILELRNLGGAPVELPSVRDNNVITNYVLSDRDGRELVSVNHVTRQLLMEKTEPRTTDELVITLGPGAVDAVRDNFCRYHWLIEPGVYHLRAVYRTKERELVSAPVRFEVLAAPLVSLHSAPTYHYGESFLLESVWCAALPTGKHQVVLRESTRFSPEIIESNAPLAESAGPIHPRVSFNRSLLAGGPVWVCWLADATLQATRAEQGVSVLGPIAVDLPPKQCHWVGGPFTNPDGSLTCLLTFADDAGEWSVMGLKLDAAGQKHGRRLLTSLPASARGLTVTVEQDGGLDMLWFDATSSELWAQAVDLDTLSVTGAARALGRSRLHPLAVVAPPVVGRDGYVSTVAVERDTVVFDWWTTRGPGGVVKSTSVPLSGAERATHAVGAMTITQPVAVLVVEDQHHYVSAALGQTLKLDLEGLPDKAVPEQLLMNARKDVFLSWGAVGLGIADRRIHLGSEFDLSAL